ncbi:transmembrane protease serine 9-like [Neocloeon triangulifer]|uniref:transmembrane protease serine 9-like n=1 Tax=Neocloeon triangulifer TaxID=2078957 RepID=UPI00286ED6B4|nr:transmembrane protease serine 9-like [Neocloeon triangulifer]
MLLHGVAASAKNTANNEWWAYKTIVPGARNARRPIHSNAKSLLNPQIIGGSVATLGQFPWHGWLDVSDATGAGFLCGCSLIADKWAMSAGHCIELGTKYTHTVFLGTIARSSPSSGYVSKISTAIRHEKYDSAAGFNDISLLKFQTAVTFTDNIKPIALPSASLVVSTGTVGTVSGFGRISDSNQDVSDDLKYADLQIVAAQTCINEYKAWFETANMICARAANKDQADCQGDSGGPFVINAAAADVTQVGIVSFGGESCLGTPSVYTKVSAYVGWIATKMAGDTSTTKSTTTKKPTTSKTTKRPTTPKPANCLSGNYKNMKTCCSPASNDLVAPIKGYKTCKNSAGFVAFNVFGLNKVQNVKINNNVDFTNTEALLKAVWKEGSFVDCYLNEKEVIVNGEIDTDALTSLLTQNQDTSGPWVEIITEAVTSCSDFISAYNIPTEITYNKVTFDIRGYLTVQCVVFTTIEACPTRVASKNPCLKDYNLFDSCKSWFIDQFAGAASSKKRMVGSKTNHNNGKRH